MLNRYTQIEAIEAEMVARCIVIGRMAESSLEAAAVQVEPVVIRLAEEVGHFEVLAAMRGAIIADLEATWLAALDSSQYRDIGLV